MNLPDVLILGAASWRLAFMVVREDGPAHVFARIRQRSTLAGLLDCVFCMSVWAAVALWLLWLTPARPLVYIMAISGAGLMLASWTGVEFKND